MPFQRVWTGMRFASWIKMSAGGTHIRRAAVAKFMNVKTMIARCESCYLCLNLHSIGNFGEGNGTAHLTAGCGMKHRDGLQRSGRFFCGCLRLRGETCER